MKVISPINSAAMRGAAKVAIAERAQSLGIDRNEWAKTEAAKHIHYLWRCTGENERIEYLAAALLKAIGKT